MIFQKGFSLLEVLLSLILLTAFSLVLFKQQAFNRQWLMQLELRANASQLLDQMDESLFAGIKRPPLARHPYHVDVQVDKHASSVQIHWFHHTGMIMRKRSFLVADPYKRTM